MVRLLSACLLPFLMSLSTAYGFEVAIADRKVPRDQPMVTAPAWLAGGIAWNDLVGRQTTDQEVFGYFDGNPADPQTCAAPGTFQTTVSDGAYHWGCCPGTCASATTCLNYNDHSLTTPTPVWISSTIYCGSSSQGAYCARRYFVDSSGQTYTLSNCGSSNAPTRTIYEDATVTTRITITTGSTTSDTTATSSSSSSSSSSSRASSPISATTSLATPSPAGPPDNPSSNTDASPQAENTSRSSPTNVGAIAGGAIGGAAAIGLIASGLAVLLRRKRKQRRLTGTGAITQYEPEQEPKYGAY